MTRNLAKSSKPDLHITQSRGKVYVAWDMPDMRYSFTVDEETATVVNNQGHDLPRHVIRVVSRLLSEECTVDLRDLASRMVTKYRA